MTTRPTTRRSSTAPTASTLSTTGGVSPPQSSKPTTGAGASTPPPPSLPPQPQQQQQHQAQRPQGATRPSVSAQASNVSLPPISSFDSGSPPYPLRSAIHHQHGLVHPTQPIHNPHLLPAQPLASASKSSVTTRSNRRTSSRRQAPAQSYTADEHASRPLQTLSPLGSVSYTPPSRASVSGPPPANPSDIPEAALHLLRLSLPSTASVATTGTTRSRDHDFDDEDDDRDYGDDRLHADDGSSDNTSVMSDDSPKYSAALAAAQDHAAGHYFRYAAAAAAATGAPSPMMDTTPPPWGMGPPGTGGPHDAYPYFPPPQGPIPPYGYAMPPAPYLYPAGSVSTGPRSTGSHSRRTSVGSSAASHVGTIASGTGGSTSNLNASNGNGANGSGAGPSGSGTGRKTGNSRGRVRQHRPARTQREQSAASTSTTSSRLGHRRTTSTQLVDSDEDMSDGGGKGPAHHHHHHHHAHHPHHMAVDGTAAGGRTGLRPRAGPPSSSGPSAPSTSRAPQQQHSLNISGTSTTSSVATNTTNTTSNGKRSSVSEDGDSDAFMPPPQKRARAAPAPGVADGSAPASPAGVVAGTSAAAGAAAAAGRRSTRRAAPPPTGATTRSFPPHVDRDMHFWRLYRQFPISVALDSFHPACWPIASYDSSSTDERSLAQQYAHAVELMPCPEGAKFNKINDIMSLYTPRFTRGVADEKVGLCPICVESPERGGDGDAKWLKLKNSSYVYHMSFAHGISNLTGLPFSPPLKIRTVTLKKETRDGRSEMKQGLCHKCNTWQHMQSSKNIEMTVPELIWWKHAKACHGTSRIQGEDDYYVRDEVFDLVMLARERTAKRTS